jgi:hypothetical protein
MSLFEHPWTVAVLLITAKLFQKCDAELLRGRHKKIVSWREAIVCIHANFFHIQHFDGRNLSQVTLSNRFAYEGL